jgi:uncharacterized protein YdeI (YjbR/CyaY-like superfamily)
MSEKGEKRLAKRNPDVDAYVTQAPTFAKPILKRLRTTIHKGCPKVVEEIKWGAPFYLYQKRVLCATMAFKGHCALVFWKAALIVKKNGKKAKSELKQLRRISSLQDLPSERELLAYIRLAMHFNEPTTQLPPREKRSAPVKVPSDLMRALRSNRKALATFNAFTPTRKKDYIYWITGAKTEKTRAHRLATAVEWMSQGKPRNWKYEALKKKKR